MPILLYDHSSIYIILMMYLWYSSNAEVNEDTDTNGVAVEPAKVSSTHDRSWLYGTHSNVGSSTVLLLQAETG